MVCFFKKNASRTFGSTYVLVELQNPCKRRKVFFCFADCVRILRLRLESVGLRPRAAIQIEPYAVQFVHSLFNRFEAFVHVDTGDSGAQDKRHEPGEERHDKGCGEPHEPTDSAKRAEAYRRKDEPIQKAREGIAEQNSDEGGDKDFTENISVNFSVLIAEHHQSGDFAVAFADIDICQRIDDENG